MKYTVNSDTRENHNNGMCEAANWFEVEAASAIDAIIKHSKQANEKEEVISCDDDNCFACAFRDEDGTYEFHVYSGFDDMAFRL